MDAETPQGEPPTIPDGSDAGAGGLPPSWPGQHPPATPASPYPGYPPYPYPYAPPGAMAPRRGGVPWYVWLIGGCLGLLALTVIGCVVVAGLFTGLALHSLHQESASDIINRTVLVTGTPTLVVADGNGSVTINNGRSDMVGIQITRVARANTVDEARRDLDGIQVNIAQQGQTITITTNFTQGGGLLNNDREVDLVITVPTRTNTRISTDAGTVELDDLSGTQQVTTGAGDVRMSGVTFADGSRVRAQVGDATLRGALAPGATLDVELSAGDAHLTLPADTTAHLTATTDAGNISVSGWRIGPPSGQGAGKTLTGDLGAASGAASGTITVHVSAGDITLDQG